MDLFHKKGYPMDPFHHQFGAFFRVAFRNRCVCLSKAGRVSNELCAEFLAGVPGVCFEEEKRKENELFEAAIRQAQMLWGKPKRVALWVLSQPSPVSKHEVAAAFGTTERSARRLIALGSQTIAARARFFNRKEGE